jgi:hypothetical protein
MTSDLSRIKDVLIEDYRYCAEAFRRNEQLGETRVNLFVAFCGAVLTLLGFVLKDRGTTGDRLKLIVLTVLLILLCLGFMTLIRLVKRDVTTDDYKCELDDIRLLFKDFVIGDDLLRSYFPFRYAVAGNLRSFGGLSHLMAIINSLLFAGFIAACLVLKSSKFLS